MSKNSATNVPTATTTIASARVPVATDRQSHALSRVLTAATTRTTTEATTRPKKQAEHAAHVDQMLALARVEDVDATDLLKECRRSDDEVGRGRRS